MGHRPEQETGVSKRTLKGPGSPLDCASSEISVLALNLFHVIVLSSAEHGHGCVSIKLHSYKQAAVSPGLGVIAESNLPS